RWERQSLVCAAPPKRAGRSGGEFVATATCLGRLVVEVRRGAAMRMQPLGDPGAECAFPDPPPWPLGPPSPEYHPGDRKRNPDASSAAAMPEIFPRWSRQ